MMRTVVLLLLAVSLSACSIFGGKKTRLVPQAYMPEPPKILMQPPRELNTIKKNNIEITEEKVSVSGPEE